jgi:autotransporter-associated beta strand protein
MSLKIPQRCMVIQMQSQKFSNSYFLLFLLFVGAMITYGKAWAQCSGDTVISSDTTSAQSNSSSLCSFRVLSGKSINFSGHFSTGIENASNSTITTLINAGTISTSGIASPSITNSGTISTFGNVGTISTSNENSFGVFNNGSGSTITTLINQGTIATSGANAHGIYNLGTITTLTNTGTISTGGARAYGIKNFQTLSTLNNLQGSASSPLIYTAYLPTNYNIIISDNNFGQLAATGALSRTSFGVYAGSTLSVGTYSSVLTGVTRSNFSNYNSIIDWNNFNSSYKWKLSQVGFTTTWDLIVAARASNIQSGATNLLSSVGGGLNPVLDGGTLRVDSATTTTTAFTIKSTGGRIDTNGLRAVFSGAFSNAAGETGKLTITNTGVAGEGAVVLGTSNTHTGGTEVQAGAVLSISSSDALGSGALDLVGSSTVPATLAITATTTIANAITVSGDPVFNVASGTTTTISSPMTDGASSGDVVITGGGTLDLTAVNTYTGPTTVDAGSTLALSGAGSIATSGSVTNNGTFNITGKAANVSVASYTQGSNGTLTMNVSPTDTQKLIVTGAASLAGALSLTGSAGTYQSGRYALLSAGSVSGTFGTLSTNLSSLTTLGYQLAYDAANVYLVFTPNVADTQQSLVNTSQVLQDTFALQNAVLANSLGYDCNKFGGNGVCISTGGRYTAVSAADGLNNTSALLIAAYRLNQNYRIGAYVDQNLSVNNAGSTVRLGNNTPLIGLFGAWNEKLDGTGTEVKVSAAYGKKNTTVNRQVVATSEQGTGSSQLNSQGAQVAAKHGFAVTDQAIVSPYIGMRYTQNNMQGYTEGTTDTVTAPLTYSALNTRATTVLTGVGVTYKINPTVTTFASAGVEADTKTGNGSYSGTNSNISGLTTVNFNANPVKVRASAVLGAHYDLEKNQRFGISGSYRQESYKAVSTTTLLATYTVGL